MVGWMDPLESRKAGTAGGERRKGCREEQWHIRIPGQATVFFSFIDLLLLTVQERLHHDTPRFLHCLFRSTPAPNQFPRELGRTGRTC